MKIILTKFGGNEIKDKLLENEMQLSSIHDTDKFYELTFSEFVRLYFKGYRTKAIIHY